MADNLELIELDEIVDVIVGTSAISAVKDSIVANQHTSKNPLMSRALREMVNSIHLRSEKKKREAGTEIEYEKGFESQRDSVTYCFLSRMAFQPKKKIMFSHAFPSS